MSEILHEDSRESRQKTPWERETAILQALTSSPKELHKYSDEEFSVEQRYITQEKINEVKDLYGNSNSLTTLENTMKDRVEKDPIFEKKEALVWSAIFAKWFGQILCSKNLQFVGDVLSALQETFPELPPCPTDLRAVAGFVKDNFDSMDGQTPEGQKSNLHVHQKIVWTQEYIDNLQILLGDRGTHILPGSKTTLSEDLTTIKCLIAQIEGEIATDSISQWHDGKAHSEPVFQSHYFDYRDALHTPVIADMDTLYQHSEETWLANRYRDSLDALLTEGGIDALTAVNLMSEALIWLTYRKIVFYQKLPIQNPMGWFFLGHIGLDGVNQTGSGETDDHFGMMKPMLKNIKNIDNVISYSEKFIKLRMELHRKVEALSNS